MKNFNVTQISIVIPVEFGNVSEVRKAGLDTILIKSKKFDVSILSPIGILYVKNSKNANLIISPNKITYTIGNSTLDEEFGIVLKEIYKKLILPEEITLSFNIRATNDSENSIEISRNIFDSKFNDVLKNISDIYGVGYRFFIKNNEIQCDIRMEPLLSDNSKYIHQISGVLKNTVKIDDIKCEIDKQIENIKIYIEPIMKQIGQC
ncbi:hypothetical protein [Clostridium sp.]|uniref:hypothetical protein n=1 Tax=Clostridium sp. TaxID=1506 RepID=UPI00359FFD33